MGDKRVITLVLEAQNDASATFDEIDNDAAALASVLADAFQGAGDDAQDAFLKIQDYADPLANLFDDLGVSADSVFSDLKVTGANAFDRLKVVGANAFDSVKEHAGTALGEVVSGAKNLFTSAFGEIRDVVQDQVKHGVTDSLTGLGVDPELAGSIGRNFGQLFGSVGDTLTSSIGGALGDLGPKIIEKLVAAQILTVPVAETGGVTIGGFLASGTILGFAALPVLLAAAAVAAIVFLIANPEIPGKILDFGVGLVRGVVNGVAGLGSGLIGAALGAIGGLVGAASGIPALLLGVGQKFVHMLIDGLAALGTLIVNEATKAIGTVITAAGKAGEIGVQLFNSGVAMVTGIVAGLVDFGTSLVGEIVKQFGGFIAGALKVGGDIFNAAISIGGGIISGTIDGLGRIGQALTNFISGEINKLPDFIINVVLHPDLSQLAGIGSLLSGNLPAFLASQGQSHESGLSFVPRDNYLANLHRGEAVLTAPQADVWRAGGGGGGATVNIGPTTLNVSGADDPEQWAARYVQSVARRLRREGIIA